MRNIGKGKDRETIEKKKLQKNKIKTINYAGAT